MDVTGFSTKSQLAIVGMRAAQQQQQAMAQVVVDAVQNAKQVASSAPASGEGAPGGRLLDIRV